MKRAVLFLIMGPALATVVASQFLLAAPGALDGEHGSKSIGELLRLLRPALFDLPGYEWYPYYGGR